MTLDEYRQSNDFNAFWRLSSGEHLNLLDEALEKIDALEAIRDKLREYEHHQLQACTDMEDGDIDPLFYDNAADERRAAEESLKAAVLMAGGMNKEAAERMAEEDANELPPTLSPLACHRCSTDNCLHRGDQYNYGCEPGIDCLAAK